jgi:hypothetical protein
METEQTNDFLLKVEPIAKQAYDLVEEGLSNSLIIIAFENEEATIMVNGSVENLVKSLVTFALNEDTRDIFFKSIDVVSKIIHNNHTNNN